MPPDFFFFHDTAPTEIYTLSLHDALPIYACSGTPLRNAAAGGHMEIVRLLLRSEEHTSELQSHSDLVCRLLLEKKKNGQPRYGDTPTACSRSRPRPRVARPYPRRPSAGQL